MNSDRPCWDGKPKSIRGSTPIPADAGTADACHDSAGDRGFLNVLTPDLQDHSHLEMVPNPQTSDCHHWLVTLNHDTHVIWGCW